MAEAKMPEQHDLDKQYPGNSYTEREKKATPIDKDVKPVVTGKAVRKKKTLGDKLKDAFLSDDSVINYIVGVCVDAAKDMVYEAVVGSLGMKFYGEAGSYSRPSRSRRTNYNGMSRSNNPTTPRMVQKAPERVHRTGHGCDDLIVNSRGEAYEVVDRLCTLIDQYKSASVADFYSLCRIPSDYTDNNFGWYDLEGRYSIRPTRDGRFQICMPPTEPIVPF